MPLYLKQNEVWSKMKTWDRDLLNVKTSAALEIWTVLWILFVYNEQRRDTFLFPWWFVCANSWEGYEMEMSMKNFFKMKEMKNTTCNTTLWKGHKTDFLGNGRFCLWNKTGVLLCIAHISGIAVKHLFHGEEGSCWGNPLIEVLNCPWNHGRGSEFPLLCCFSKSFFWGENPITFAFCQNGLFFFPKLHITNLKYLQGMCQGLSHPLFA